MINRASSDWLRVLAGQEGRADDLLKCIISMPQVFRKVKPFGSGMMRLAPLWLKQREHVQIMFWLFFGVTPRLEIIAFSVNWRVIMMMNHKYTDLLVAAIHGASAAVIPGIVLDVTS